MSVDVQRLEAILQSWIGTPFVLKQRVKGTGTDCAGFVVSVMEELTGRETGWKAPEGVYGKGINSRKALHGFLREFKCRRVRSGEAQPCDVLLVGRRGMEHAMVMGHTYVYHADTGGVCRTGKPSQLGYLKILRPVEIGECA